MSSSHEKMTEHTNHTVLNAQGEHGLGGNTSNGPVERDVVTGDIDPEDEVKGVKLLILHIGLCLCTFLVGLDFTILATAVPVITSAFNSINDVGWYGGAFYIALCASQPLIGKAFTLFPKKAIYLGSVAAFEIGSLVCALAPNSHALIVGRAVTGLGASGILGGSLILLTVVIPLHKRAVYTGTLQSMFAVASIVGPLIGGALTQNVTWRWCFYVNLPIGGFSAAVIQVFCNIKRSPTGNMSSAQKIRSLDGLGFVLFAGAIIMLLLGLQWGGTAFAWSSSVIVGLFIGAGVTFLVFAGWQVYMGDSALVPSNLFTHRNVVLILCAGFLSNGPFQILVYWLPIWFQAVLGVTPTASGVRYLPTVISDVLAAFVGGGLAMKLGMWNPLLLFGNAAIALGAGLLSTIYPGVPDGHWIGFQIFIGVGYSLVTTMAHLGMQATLPVALVPVGTSTLLAVISSGCAVFLAVGQAVFQMRLVENLSAVVSANMVNAVLGIGATEIRSIVDQADLAAVVNAYGKAVTEVFYIPAAAPVLAFLCVCFTAWISVKKSEGKDLESKNGQSTIEKV